MRQVTEGQHMTKKVYHPDGRRLVFRVQSADGEGVYKAGFAYKLIEESENYAGGRHPNAYDDRGLCNFWETVHPGPRAAEYYFGFRDMDQLTNWFMWPENMKEYADNADIVVYAVADEHVIDGQFQTIFKLREAEQVDLLALTATDFNPNTLAEEAI